MSVYVFLAIILAMVVVAEIVQIHISKSLLVTVDVRLMKLEECLLKVDEHLSKVSERLARVEEYVVSAKAIPVKRKIK